MKLFEPAFPEMQFHLTCLSGFCNFQTMKTLYDIDVNSDLIWDHDFAREQFQEEPFFIWYLGRLLERGTAEEVRKIPPKVVARYLDRLAISSRIRRFWKWYLEDA